MWTLDSNLESFSTDSMKTWVKDDLHYVIILVQILKDDLHYVIILVQILPIFLGFSVTTKKGYI